MRETILRQELFADSFFALLLDQPIPFVQLARQILDQFAFLVGAIQLCRRGLRQFQEVRAVGVKRLRGDRGDRGSQPIVEGATGCELGVRLRQIALEADDLVDAAPALRERRPHDDVGAERARCDTDE